MSKNDFSLQHLIKRFWSNMYQQIASFNSSLFSALCALDRGVLTRKERELSEERDSNDVTSHLGTWKYFVFIAPTRWDERSYLLRDNSRRVWMILVFLHLSLGYRNTSVQHDHFIDVADLSFTVGIGEPEFSKYPLLLIEESCDVCAFMSCESLGAVLW